MPSKNEITNNIPLLLTIPVYEILLLGWVSSRLQIAETMKINTAVESFFTYYNIPTELWEINTAKAFVYRNISATYDFKYGKIENKIKEWDKKTN